MVTAKIQIKPHLKEYVYGKFNKSDNTIIRFPDRLEVYHDIFNLTEKRPVNCPVDYGNLEIALPKPDSSKQPKTYNYLSIHSQKIIEKQIEKMFWHDVREYIDFGHYKDGSRYSDLVYEFMTKYGISSISEDALIKHYYRFRKKTRNNGKRSHKYKNI